MNAILTQGLTKVYKSLAKRDVRSLDGLDLSVAEGEVFGFLGRNGAGKTTTIKILCGLLRATQGEAQLFGESVRQRSARRHVGYLPEQPYFYEYLTPRETIDFYGRLRGLDPAARVREWKRLSELLDLSEIGDRRIKGFSKGMRQRVGFAVALIGDPPLLILDEPMSGLDPIGRRSIRELILRLRDEKKTLFFSSHVLGDVEQVCDRVGILVRGKLTRQGTIEGLLGTQTAQVEVIAGGLDVAAANAVGTCAVRHRRVEDLDFFVFEDAEAANAALRAIQQHGGRVHEMTSLKETLEDYFMREQGPEVADAPRADRKGNAA
jgi:ABC-2 type transport system ATP-binding protein